MAFRHGVTGNESPTRLIAAVSDGITPVYVGTAPINLCEKQYINEPMLCSSYAEAVEYFGYSDDFKNYTRFSFLFLHQFHL